MAFDRQAGRLVAVASAGSAVETWTFDVCTNTWAQMHPKQEPSSFRWADLVYDIDSRATILFSIDTDWADPGSGSSADPGSVWSYDLRADTWTKKGAAPTINPVSLAYDSVSGLVVAAEHSDRKLMWTYDVEADTWTPFPWANGPDDPVVIAYDASVDRIVAYGDERFTDDRAAERIYETWLLDMRAGTWSRSTAERPAVVGWLVAPGIVFDEAAERTVIYRRGPLTAYDAAADRWEILEAAEDDTPVKGTLVVYDSVNRRLVGWGHDTWGPTGAVAARDLLTGGWTVLLAPDEGQPAQP